MFLTPTRCHILGRLIPNKGLKTFCCAATGLWPALSSACLQIKFAIAMHHTVLCPEPSQLGASWPAAIRALLQPEITLFQSQSKYDSAQVHHRLSTRSGNLAIQYKCMVTELAITATEHRPCTQCLKTRFRTITKQSIATIRSLQCVYVYLP